MTDDKIQQPAKEIGPSVTLEVMDPHCVLDDVWLANTVRYAREHYPTAVVLYINHNGKTHCRVLIKPVKKMDTQ